MHIVVIVLGLLTLMSVVLGAVSLDPDTYVEAGLMDDFDAEWQVVQFCEWDYDGKGDPGLFLAVQLLPLGDPDAKPIVQYYSAGGLEFFKPSQDGSSIEPVSDKAALNKNTNAAQLLTSLVQADGRMKALLAEGNVSRLQGLKVHMLRKEQPKRGGVQRTGKNAERPLTVLLVSKVISMPGEGGMKSPTLGSKTQTGQAAGIATARPAQTATAAPAGRPAAAAAPSNGGGGFNVEDPVDMAAFATLMEILGKNGGAVAKTKLPTQAFQADALKQDDTKALKTKVVKRVFEDSFLSSVDGVSYDGANITLAA